jgi:hypothetical protein
VTLKELKDLVKASFITPKYNKPESTEENPNEEEGFQEVRRRKRHSSHETAKTAKKAAVQAKTPPTVSSQPEEVITRNFFDPFRAAEMETNPSNTEGSPREDPAVVKAGRPPPIFLSSTVNLIDLQKELKNVVAEAHETEPESSRRAWRTSNP